jgi:hypothetical protein
MDTGAFVNGGEIVEHPERPGGFVLEIMQNGMKLIACNPDRRDLIPARLCHENAAVKCLLQFLKKIGRKDIG